MYWVFFIQKTGCAPIKTSLNVPPPTEVAKAMIKTPKGSSFLRIAINDQDMAKAKTPKMSKTLNNVIEKKVKKHDFGICSISIK